MGNTFLYPVSSSETMNFTEALAAASGTLAPPYVASAMNNISGVPAIGSRRFLIRALKVIAAQNFGPEINIFGKAAGPTLDPQTDSFIARYQFLAVNGDQIGGTGLYRYYVDGLAIPYHDADRDNIVGVGFLHVILQNVDVTAKLAGAAGYVKLVAYLEPEQSY